MPLECLYKLTDRDGGQQFTKFYRFKNIKLLDEKGKEKKLSAMGILAFAFPNGMVWSSQNTRRTRLTWAVPETKYVPIG